jgi:hypothetical protein
MTTTMKNVSTNEFTWAVLEDAVAIEGVQKMPRKQPPGPIAWQAQEASKLLSTSRSQNAIMDQEAMHDWCEQVRDLSNGPWADAEDEKRATHIAQWTVVEKESSKESKLASACSDWEIV